MTTVFVHVIQRMKRKKVIWYKSSLTGNTLNIWIIENDFPKGFQILCHSCNFAKGSSKDNKCPHQK